MSWKIIIKAKIPCLECGKKFPFKEYDKKKWSKFFDEDGMEFDICPKCSQEGGKITQPTMNIKDKERLQ